MRRLRKRFKKEQESTFHLTQNGQAPINPLNRTASLHLLVPKEERKTLFYLKFPQVVKNKYIQNLYPAQKVHRLTQQVNFFSDFQKDTRARRVVSYKDQKR